MGFENLALQQCYNSEVDDILHDFYIPVLEQSVHYRRMAGFFSSTSLSVAARGILGLIRNGGRMEIMTSPRLTRSDVKVITEAQSNHEEFLTREFFRELDSLRDDWSLSHLRLLGWMVAHGRLSVKIAIPRSCAGDETAMEELFHPKVGIMVDARGKELSFSGSVNETGKGWLGNFEEFKVFRGWKEIERDYLLDDQKKFNRLWEEQAESVRLISLPAAVQERLVQMAPDDPSGVGLQALYEQRRRHKIPKLHNHQAQAVESWLERGCTGIFEMATGTGKTIAAIGCIDRILRQRPPLLVIVATPYKHLNRQWKREIDRMGMPFDQELISDGSMPGWANRLADCVNLLSIGHLTRVLCIATHRTFSSAKFQKIVAGLSESADVLLVGDEVHGLGAAKAKAGLSQRFGLRLGLSATPSRWFDEEGTKEILEYFGGVTYEFSLRRALVEINPDTNLTYLTPFDYFVEFVNLTHSEIDEYAELSTRIYRLRKQQETDEPTRKRLERLYFERAAIVKDAEHKFEKLSQYLDERRERLSDTILYCSPNQIDRVMRMTASLGLKCHRFTMAEGSTPNRRYGGISEREHILREFERQRYSVLVAMKCLDEGVDVPPARNAFLMASTGNPREYIQRIGRLLRRHPNKQVSNVYDVLVVPPIGRLSPEVRKHETAIFEKELGRCWEILKNARNSIDVYGKINELKEQLRRT